MELFPQNKPSVLFVDEIQNCKGWEKFLNRLYEKKIKIYVTGSNANLLSSENATSLTGRNRILPLYTFSFKEFLHYHQWDENVGKLTSAKRSLLNTHFNSYIKYGGFPLVVEEKI